MQSFANNGRELFHILLGNPSTLPELLTLTIVGTLAFILSIRVIGSLLGCSMAEMRRGGVAFFITAIPLFAAAIAVRLYISNNLSSVTGQRLVLGVILLAVWLGLVVPCTRFVIKGKYSQVLFTSLLSIAAAAALVALTRGGFRAMQAGGKGFDKAKKRHEKLTDIF